LPSSSLHGLRAIVGGSVVADVLPSTTIHIEYGQLSIAGFLGMDSDMDCVDSSRICQRVSLLPLLISTVLAGCGSPVVDPGPTRRVPRSQPNLPQGNSGTHELKGIDAARKVPEVLPSSVVNLPSDTESGSYHLVQRGETLTTIGRKFNVSVAELLNANGLDSDDPIFPDQMIYIPSAR